MPLSCLIVDDNVSLLKAAGALLEREGIAVVGVASTTSEALQLVEAHRPDVTLIDIDLGQESGFDLVHRLARDGTQRHSSILISCYAEADFADLIEASPAVGFLAKSQLSAQAIHAILA
jgi:CheY-like chemotaxis protein